MTKDFLKRYVDSEGALHEHILDVDEDLTNTAWLPIPNTIIRPDNEELFWELWNQQKTYMSNNGRDSALWESLCIWKSDTISEAELIHEQFPQKIVDWSKHFLNRAQHDRAGP